MANAQGHAQYGLAEFVQGFLHAFNKVAQLQQGPVIDEFPYSEPG
jgi:hypothetical protein